MFGIHGKRAQAGYFAVMKSYNLIVEDKSVIGMCNPLFFGNAWIGLLCLVMAACFGKVNIAKSVLSIMRGDLIEKLGFGPAQEELEQIDKNYGVIRKAAIDIQSETKDTDEILFKLGVFLLNMVQGTIRTKESYLQTYSYLLGFYSDFERAMRKEKG